MGTDDTCPHRDLDWYQRWIWLKVDYCINANAQVLFDDDPKVIEIATRFAPALCLVRIVAG
jgi:hypothetical protein